MIYKVSTTGLVPEVVLHDLGARTLIHPITNLDLGLEYSDNELTYSKDLATAIAAEWLIIEEFTSLNDDRYYVQDELDDIITNLDHNSLLGIENDKHKYLTTVLSTGLLKGGRLYLNEQDNTKFDIEAGIGVIVDNYTNADDPSRKIVHWPTTSGIACEYINTYEWSTVCITRTDPGDGLGTIIQIPDRLLTDEERREMLTIGFLTHITGDRIAYTETEPYTISDPVSQIWDFAHNFGSFNIEGNEYTCAGSLTLKKTGGKTYSIGSNYINSSKSPNIWVSEDQNPLSEIIYYYRQNGEWVNSDITTNVIDPDWYDSGDGLLPVTTSGWTIQTIFFYAPWETTEIQYGQKVYESKELALAALNERIEINPWITEYDTFRGWLVVRQGAEPHEICQGETHQIISACKMGLISSAYGGSGSGEINIAENNGLSGVSILLPKEGVILPFKSVASGDDIVNVYDNETDKSIEISINESGISHNNISALDSDDHTQYHNDARGDNRYYTKSQTTSISGALDDKMLYSDGSKPLTGDWNAGDHSIGAGGFYLNTAKLDAAIFSCSTGLLTGGNILKCPEDETKIHIDEGTSLYVNMNDRENPIVEILSWESGCFYPSISGVDTKWIGIERTAPGVGSFTVRNKFSQLEKRYITILGRCWNFSGTDVIEGVGNYKAGAFNNDKTTQDLAYALGSINVYGNKYFTTVSGTMRLSRTHGEAFRFSANFSNSEISPNIYESLLAENIDYYTYHVQGTASENKTQIDPDNYDNGGIVTEVPSGKWTIQRVYYYPVSNITAMVYGQHIYDTYEDAYANMFTENITLNRGTMEGTVFRGYLVIKQGCDDLTDPSKANLFEASSLGAFSGGGGGGGGGVTNHSALDGLGNDDHTQYILHNGTRNFSGVVKYSHQPTFNNDDQIITKKYVDDAVLPFTAIHSELKGLANDDHAQYILVNGSRGFTSAVSGITPTQQNHLVTKGYVDDITELSAVQIRRTTDITVGTSYANVTFDTTDFENNSDVLEHSSVNTDRILIKSSGNYKIMYHLKPRASTATVTTNSRVLIDDTAVIPGSESYVRTYQNEIHELTCDFVISLTAGSYLSLQVSRGSESAVTAVADAIMYVIKTKRCKR
jgi:hypothetical protein